MKLMNEICVAVKDTRPGDYLNGYAFSYRENLPCGRVLVVWHKINAGYSYTLEAPDSVINISREIFTPCPATFPPLED